MGKYFFKCARINQYGREAFPIASRRFDKNKKICYNIKKKQNFSRICSSHIDKIKKIW